MKRIFTLLLISLLTLQTFAADLVLIPTRNFNETKIAFSNPALQVNFYKDEFVIATAHSPLKMDYLLLDKNPWQENYSYYLVYVDETVDKKAYYDRINEVADVLFDDGNRLVLRIDEQIYGQLPPAKNDGTVRIKNRKVVLPMQMFYNNTGRFDPDPLIVNLLAEVSGTNITATIQHLQDYGTRNCYKPESIEAQNWIKSQFENMGLSVELQDFTMPNGPASDNVIATLPGTKYPDEFIVIGGHFDSITYSGLEPGADDNASGTSGVMEIARILSQYEFDRTLIFCAFSGEEYGLYGSGAYADRCAQEGMNIHGYLNLDMIGYLEPGSYIHTDLMYPSSAQELANFYTEVCGVYLPDFPVETGTLIGGDSDHTSFNNAGFMGIFPFEDGNAYSPYIHTSNDIIGPSFNNEDQAVIFTKAILATAVSMANRLTPPQNLVALPGDSEVTLQWAEMFDIDYYNIYKNNVLLTTTTEANYLDQDVANGTLYEYYLTAIYSDSGDESDPSNVVSATPMPPLALPLSLNFENGAPYWDFEDDWGLSTGASHSPSHAITESPSGNYASEVENYATLTAFGLETYTSASLSFWTKYNLESGYDYMWLELSTNGSTWIELDEFNGTQNTWIEKSYSLDEYLDESYIIVRFHFESDYSVTEDGMYIDDFQINALGGMMSQNLVIPAGWSGLSSYIQPENEAITNVLAPIEGELIIVQSMNGMWYPSNSINTIGNWDGHSGYKIKLENEETLQIAGIAEVDKTMTLSSGWNLLPVLSNTPVSSADLFESNWDDLIIIKEIAGLEILWPGEDITTLNNLSPANAYMVKVANDITISFAGMVAQALEKPKPAFREGWDLLPPSGNSHIIALPADLLSIFEIGDQIGVFNGNGACAGYAEVESFDNNIAMVVYGDDMTTTETDGMDENEVFNFRLYRSSTNLEYGLIASFDASMPNQQLFAIEGISKLETLVYDNTVIVENLTRTAIYPNPATNQIHVAVEGLEKARLEIINIQGQLIMDKTIADDELINTADFAKGIYTFRISSKDYIETQKVIVN